MKKKQYALLKYLSLQNKPVTCTKIANALSISNSSVKNYINDINSLYSKKIILSSRNGYELNQQFILPINHNNKQIPQTDEERSFYIIKELILHHSTYLDVFDLCENLYVSYSTIKSLLVKMNKTFSSYHIKFTCEKELVKVFGSEKNKRKLISFIINEESKNSFVDIQQLQVFFNEIDINKLKNIITDIFKNYNFYLNDFAFMNLMLHLSIIIDREKKFKPLDSGSSDYLIENKTEQMFITEFIQELENAFHIQINSYEQFEIYMLFKANTNYSLSVSDDCLRQTIGYEISELTDRFIEQINNLYLIDLSSECFTIPFSLHLKNLLFRLETGKQINNPLAESLKENSPIVFDIAAFIALDISEHYKYNVNEDEIAFLAMHIGAEIERQNENLSKIKAVLLCPNYRNMASILLNKLMLSFGNQLNIISIVHDEQSLENLHYSILFTTIPLHNFYNCEIIQVSPFNLEQQHNTIMNAILICQERKKNAKLRKNFHSFFEQDLFVADIHSCDYKEIISFLCHKLLKKNYINPDFEEMVYKRENAATTAFANIAIPHSVNMDAIKTCIAVAISKHGIKWGQNTVYLVLLLAINKADQKTFRELYESLISLFSSSSMIQKVRDCSKFEDFETLIYRELEDSPS